ncbi:hypothetical protein D3C73_1137420 [compost metagenome]
MRIRNEKGVTLVELLAAITISAFILGLIFTVIQQSTQGFATITSKQFAQEHGRIISEHMVHAVRERPYIITQINSKNGIILKLQDPEAIGNYIQYTFNSATHNFIIENSVNNTVSSTEVARNVTSASVELSDPVTVNSVQSQSKITLALEFKVEKKSPFTYQTVIYVPTLN